MRVSPPLLACLLVLAVAAPAAADEEIKIAVVDFVNRGADDILVQECSSRVNAELHKLGVFKVTSRDDIKAMISHEKERALLGCEEASCLAEIGGALGVDYMVTGLIIKNNDRHTLDLRLVNIRKASVENVFQQAVEGDTKAVVDRAGDGAVALVSKMFAQKQGSLVLVCDEPGATVKVDGAEWTTTPVRGSVALPFGPHTIEVAKTGFLAWRERISIQPKQAIERSVLLVPSPDFIEDYESRNGKYRLGAWITTGVAVAATGAAGYFGVTADQTYQDFKSQRDELGQDPSNETLRSEATGKADEVRNADTATLISGGVALLSAGIATWLWIAGDDPDRYEKYRTITGPTGGAPAPAPSGEASPASASREAPPIAFDPARLALVF